MGWMRGLRAWEWVSDTFIRETLPFRCMLNMRWQYSKSISVSVSRRLSCDNGNKTGSCGISFSILHDVQCMNVFVHWNQHIRPRKLSVNQHTINTPLYLNLTLLKDCCTSPDIVSAQRCPVHVQVHEQMCDVLQARTTTTIKHVVLTVWWGSAPLWPCITAR